MVELVMRVEQHSGIDIPDGVAATLDTPGKLKCFVGLEVGRGRCAGNRLRYRSHSEISAAIDWIVEDETGIERFTSHDGSHFVEDLGLG